MTPYARRLEDWETQRRQLERSEFRWSLLRIGLFVVGVVLAWQTFAEESLSGWWLLLPLLLFLVAMSLHDRVIRRRRMARRAESYYQRGIDRLEGRWAEQGDDGARFGDEHHPYASDLDLFGSGSLFQRINQARSEPGKQRLSNWLKEAAAVDIIRERQEAVQELSQRQDVREALAVVGEEVERNVDLDSLQTWLADSSSAPRWPAIAAVVLAVTNVTTLALWWAPMIDGVQPVERFWEHSLPCLLSALASAILVIPHLRRTRRVLEGVGRPAALLQLFAALLERIENETFRSKRLRELHDRLGVPTSSRSASASIRRLRRLVEIQESRANMILHAFGGLTLLGTQLAFAMDRWRVVHGDDVLRWFDALAEIEALASLGTYRYERPDDLFPELLEEGPHYRAQGLGHPLIDGASCIRNDLILDGDQRLYLVSGSNMSGKSTWLRSVGINAVLAFSGAPVCAHTMTIAPLRIGASMRISDSLQQGLSHFYAEIKRLRFVVDLTAGERPVLFLLDEILHGTNSHDRRIGAQALIRGLVEKGAVGLVTTHDLALAEIVNSLAPHARNVHFADRLEGDQVIFDFSLREGVVQHSNALALMRAIGLEV